MPASTTTLDGLGLATPYREIAYKSDAALEAEFADYAALGVKWLRTDFWWETAQPTPNGYDWSGIDRIVDMATKYDIEIVAILNGTPQWGYNDLTKSSTQKAFGEFASAAAEHFADRVNYWQIGNEPNLASKIDPATYTKMLQVSYDAIKAVDSSDIVVTAGLASVPSTQNGHIGAVEFLQKMYENGAKDHFDALGYHPYTYPLLPENPASWNGWQIMQNGIRAAMVANGDADIDIWITEIGAPTAGGSGAMTQEGQALVLKQTMELSENLSWAGPVMWYSYKDRGGATTNTENWFGLVGPNGEKKDAYWAFKELAEQYNGTDVIEEPPVVVVPQPEVEPAPPTPPATQNEGQVINGTNAANIINGGAGDDVIRAGGGNDTISGGAGKDTIYGDDGNDTIYGGAGDDVLKGGIGNDSIRGGSNNDSIYGEDGDDLLWGDDGDDTVDGGNGNDVIRGGDGNDILSGGAGADTLYGENGNDALYGGSGDDILHGGAGQDSIRGGSNNDTISGGDGDDMLWGDDGNDIIWGDAGADTLRGGAGNDILGGGAGNDAFYGEDGNDILYAGLGSDILSGGAGNDRFVFDNASLTRLDVDTIIDFQKGDIIDLSAIDAKSTQSGNQAFTFVGSKWLTNAGDLGFYQDKANNQTHIQVDVNGDRTYDMDIVLKGIHTLTQSDFIL